MPVLGILFLLAGIVLFIISNIHAPEQGVTGVRWVYKPEFYFLFLVTSILFISYGIYEIVAELRSKGKERSPAGGLPADQTKKCPRCAEYIKSEAKVCRYCRHEFGEEELMPVVIQPLPKSCGLNLPALLAAGVAGAILLGAGFYCWQTTRQDAPLTPAPKGQGEVQPPVKTEVVPVPADKVPGSQKPADSPARETPGPIRVGSEWALDWRSKYRYRGILQIKEQVGPNRFAARLTVRFATHRNKGKIVSMDGVVIVRGNDVVINCRNPSVSWWDTDDFFLKLDQNTMTGYNVDKKGRRGEAVFTLID